MNQQSAFIRYNRPTNKRFFMAIGPMELIRRASPAQRRTLLAASMGWGLDAFDAMLYSLVLAMLMRDLGMGKTTAGALGTLTLLASGIGGVLFGFLADRIGRKLALMASILTYSVCSFGSGLSTSIAMLAVARFVLGLGMGGEWNTGATLLLKRGQRSCVQKRFPSCRVRGPWDLQRRRSLLGRWRGGTDGGRFSSSAYCPRLLRSGFSEKCQSRRCGGNAPLGLKPRFNLSPCVALKHRSSTVLPADRLEVQIRFPVNENLHFWQTPPEMGHPSI